MIYLYPRLEIYEEGEATLLKKHGEFGGIATWDVRFDVAGPVVVRSINAQGGEDEKEN